MRPSSNVNLYSAVLNVTESATAQTQEVGISLRTITYEHDVVSPIQLLGMTCVSPSRQPSASQSAATHWKLPAKKSGSSLLVCCWKYLMGFFFGWPYFGFGFTDPAPPQKGFSIVSEKPSLCLARVLYESRWGRTPLSEAPQT